MSGLLLAGDVYFDRYDDLGNLTGSVGPINTTKLEINTPSESLERPSQQKDSYGQALDDITLAQATQMAITFDDQPAELLALALMGAVEEVSQGAGNIADFALTLPSNGRWVKLPHGNLEQAGISAKLAADDSPVSDAAYEVKYAMGLVRATPGGALANGGDIKLSYSHAATDATRIKGAMRPTARVRVLVDGTNLANGRPVKLDVPEYNCAPTSAVDLMAQQYVSTELGGKVILRDGETAPFYLDQE